MMDPFRNPALQSAKLEAILESSSSSASPSSSTHRVEQNTQTSLEEMPAPPAYHMVVDPAMPIPNVRSPYDPEEDIEEEGKEHDDDDTPEVTINAATQIRGHGNIISIAQMDSVRIANLITSLLSGEKTSPDVAYPTTPPTSVSAAAVSPQHTSRTEVRGVKKFPNINITVNCGATIIGDRNIVGPGLGDIARQMQMAQRNQALLAQQQAAAAAAANGQKMPSLPLQRRDTLYQAQAAMAQQHHGVPSPPMSRSSSLGSEAAGVKRKADGGCGESAKRHC
jgi:hypothetical protein